MQLLEAVSGTQIEFLLGSFNFVRSKFRLLCVGPMFPPVQLCVGPMFPPVQMLDAVSGTQIEFLVDSFDFARIKFRLLNVFQMLI